MNKRPKLDFKTTVSLFFRLLGRMFRGHPVMFLLCIPTIIVGVAVQSIGALFIGQILINQFIEPSIAAGRSPDQIVGVVNLFGNAFEVSLLTAVLTMAGLYLLGVVCVFLYRVMACIVGQSAQMGIRNELFEKMESLPLKYFDTRIHGDIMSVYTNDVDTLRELTSRVLPTVVQMLFAMLIALITMISTGSWPLLLVVLGFFVVILTTITVVTKQSSKYFIAQQRILGQTNGYIEEMISGQKVVKVFNHEEENKEGFDQLNESLCKNVTKSSQFSSILGPITNNLSNMMYVVLASVGAAGISAGIENLSVGTIVSFLSLGRSFIMPIAQLASQINMIIVAMAGAQRIFAMIDETPETDQGYVSLVNAKEGPDGQPIEVTEKTGLWAWKHPHTDGSGTTYTWLAGKITMDHVDFGYNKVNRFYDIEDGKIRFDDININKIKKKDLRRAMGMVLQDTNLFTASVRENIRYGNPDATDEEVENAAKLANADGFIRMLPEGYDTVLRSAGADLSQGQRQLLSIARAACANPPVLILDEATSSIDSRTEKIVAKGMDAIMEGRTVFVIAHRLSTIQNSNVIIVLENGHVSEKGNHEQLLAAKGKYYQLYTGGKQ